MLWGYGHYKYFYSYSAGIVFRCQILTSKVYPRAVRVKHLRYLKAYFASLKNDLISYTDRRSKRKIFMALFNNYNIYFSIATYFKSSSCTKSQEFSNSRLVVDEDDSGKFRLEMVLN